MAWGIVSPKAGWMLQVPWPETLPVMVPFTGSSPVGNPVAVSVWSALTVMTALHVLTQ
ncbi:hypothetical protein [Streptacidiphilus neutrinimicus]|uniref:hypothetical protein n=1 Tax=Streptacidiphilus neutrinimicus TaxID=105420 RepID=UPI001377E598|nr:hypothetical protein [Streptacidiphilus neutrinimicus]